MNTKGLVHWLFVIVLVFLGVGQAFVLAGLITAAMQCNQ